jgi:hypothetical protein
MPMPHLGMRWTTIPGWVLARDPCGQVLWQYRVDRTAQIVTGPGAVLVHDTSGLRALDDHGSITPLPPLPADAQVLAIAGGAAWFATGERGWRLGLADGAVESLALGDLPIGAPLVRGPQSLWLTMRELLLFDGVRLVHRLRHGLPAGAGWRLGADGERPLVLADDGRHWRLESFADQAARLGGKARAALLLQASRYDEVLALLGEPADDEARGLALRAHLGLGPAHLAGLGTAALDLACTAQDQALVWSARLASPATLPPSLVLGPTAAPPGLLAGIDALAGRDATVRFTSLARQLADPPTAWDHVFSGRAWMRWRAAPGRPRPTLAGGHLVATDSTAITTVPAEEPRRSDGTVVADGLVYRLERDIDHLAVSCRDQDGVLLWQHRWRPPPFLSAPSQNLDLQDGLVYVLEGGLRLSVLDAALGMRVGDFTSDELASGTPYLLATGQLAVLGPLGVDRQLTVLGPQGATHTTVLPSPARWGAAVGDHLLLHLRDGSTRLFPGGAEVLLPAPLAAASRAPRVTPGGLVLDQVLWCWVR